MGKRKYLEAVAVLVGVFCVCLEYYVFTNCNWGHIHNQQTPKAIRVNWGCSFRITFLENFQAECNSSNTGEPSRKEPQHLNALLDYLLDPEKDVNNQDTIDWCRWLVGGGTSYEDFSQTGKLYILVVPQKMVRIRG